jgi:hypothetical protein
MPVRNGQEEVDPERFADEMYYWKSIMKLECFEGVESHWKWRELRSWWHEQEVEERDSDMVEHVAGVDRQYKVNEVRRFEGSGLEDEPGVRKRDDQVFLLPSLHWDHED